MLMLFQFQMTHGKDEMDDLQCKSCVCVLCFGQLLEHYSLYSMLKRKKEQLFAWLPETFSLSPPPSPLLSLSLHENVPRR